MATTYHPAWPRLLRDPIGGGLLLSAALHLAVLVVIQPTPGGGAPRTLVINARLEAAPATPPEVPPVETGAAPETPPPPPEEPAPSPPLPQLTTPEPSPISLPPTPAEPLPAIPSPARAVPVPTAPTPPAPRAGPAAGSPLPSLPLGIDPTWYNARQVDSQPRPIGDIQPAYPEEAKRINLEGSVKILLKIDELGRVQEAEVVEASHPGAFDGEALRAFRQARFKPAMKDGRPVRYQAYMRVDFRLED
ncbi:MAG: TonB family protein [Pseudomonadota bacterium]